MSKSPNRLLASLPADAFSAISPHLKIVELKFGDVVAEAGSPIRQVYFPYSGVISLVVELDVGHDDRDGDGGPRRRLERGLCSRRQGVSQ